MIIKIKESIKNYFNNSDIEFIDVLEGRTNLNYFIKVGDKQYFVRTSISKVQDVLFGGLLQKEKEILEILGEKGISPKLIYSEINEDFGFLIIEKIEAEEYIDFVNNLEKLKVLLKNFQKIDTNLFKNLTQISLKKGYREVIKSRLEKINVPELIEINNNLSNFLFNKKYNFEEENCLVHNDFRLDNLIITKQKAFLIDVEGMTIGDSYLDLGEYYVGGIFWNTFPDKKEFNFQEFSKLMDDFGYKDKEKQLFVFILKFCSNFSWLSSYISEYTTFDKVYKKSLQRNKKHYYDVIEKLIK